MNLGFLSFRIAGNDGVSLEAVRWRTVLERLGHKVTFIAGELDRRGILIPELHFTSPHIHRIHELVIQNNVSYKKVEKEIFTWAGKLEGELREILPHGMFDRLIVANVFSLPIHFPLAVALDRFITDHQLPTISRNHDFWWERSRYRKSYCFDFFKRYFPPKNPLIKHVTINSLAHRELKQRTGLSSVVIGDSFDFASRLSRIDKFSANFREDFGISKDDIVFLQPTRIVPRKGIELSIDLVKKLNDNRIVLVLAGDPSDEGLEYALQVNELAKEADIRTKFIGLQVNARRRIKNNKRIYTLWDCFRNCDFVTYPSKMEGFGNQFIEAVYFKKPILVNRYPVYKADLEPLGFKTITIDGKVTARAVEEVKAVLADPDRRKRMVETNFRIGKKHFSFTALRHKLKKLGL